MAKKHNVNIIFTQLGNVDLSTNCDRLTKVQIRDRLEKIAKLDLVPEDSCVYRIDAEFNDTKTFGCTLSDDTNENAYPVETSNSHLDVRITRKGKDYCKHCTIYDCISNLESGKCTDEFMIKAIGKNFFLNKYKGKTK